ncbi:MAG: hypothetical protein HKN04_14215 [Rhodothermaceae bacterium]|nr:hypothetical protein [Rhodothermaceae bacterium]
MRGRLPWPRPLTPRRRQDLARDIEEELRTHLELRTGDNQQAGLAEADAKADALARFGDLEQIAEACLQAEEDHPVRTAQRLATMGLMLTIGFAAFALTFALLYAALLRPIRFDEADRLVRVGEGWRDAMIPVEESLMWRTEGASFEHLTVFSASEFTLMDEQGAARVHTMMIGDAYFEVFQVEPLLGRTFAPEEVEAQAAPVVLLSESLWTNRYRRSLAILGKPMMLDGEAYTIVGVMPTAAQLLHGVDVWTPLFLAEGMERKRQYVVARLQEGVTLAEAESEAAELSAQLLIANPKAVPVPVSWHPMRALYVDPVRPTVLLLFSVGMLVLALVLAVALRRVLSRTLRIHLLTLGGGPGWLQRLEYLSVALVSAVLGLAVAYQVRGALYDSLLGRWGTLFDQQVDGVVALIVLLLAVGIGLGLTVMPHWLKQKVPTRQTMHFGLDRSLSAMVVAMAVLLLVAFGQTARPFLETARQPLGFDEDRVFVADLPITGATADVWDQYPAVVEAVRTLPGVEAASLSQAFPVQTQRFDSYPLVLGSLGSTDESVLNDAGEACLEVIGTDYVETMGLAVLSGRSITASDVEGAEQVALVNATLAEQYWPGENPLGKRVDLGGNAHIRTVVGVVSDVHYYGGEVGLLPIMYVPQAQSFLSRMNLIVRSEADSEALASAIQVTIRDVAPTMSVEPIGYASAVRHAVVRDDWTALWLLGLMAIGALLCAVAGTAQLVTDHVRERLDAIAAERTHGVRAGRVLLHAWRPALITVSVGVVLGLIAAWGLTQGLAPDLLGEVDGEVWAWAAGVVAVVMLVVSLVPARQALDITPSA